MLQQKEIAKIMGVIKQQLHLLIFISFQKTTDGKMTQWDGFKVLTIFSLKLCSLDEQ